MTTRYDLPPCTSSLSRHADLTEPPPWMPLDLLMAVWASFGYTASSEAALRATSAAFAALAEERDALHLVTSSQADPPQPLNPRGLGLPAVVLAEQPVIAALTRASAHWLEAASALAELAEFPAELSCAERLPLVTDLETLLGYTLLQRERVWAIAYALLAGHLHPFHDRLTKQGAAPVPPDADQPQQTGGQP